MFSRSYFLSRLVGTPVPVIRRPIVRRVINPQSIVVRSSRNQPIFTSDVASLRTPQPGEEIIQRDSQGRLVRSYTVRIDN